MDDDTLLLIAAGGLAYLLLVQPRQVPPYTAQARPGGQFGINIPGLGQYSTGPGGTNIALDPRLFQGLFAQPQPVPPPEFVPSPVVEPPPQLSAYYPPSPGEGWEMPDPCEADPWLCGGIANGIEYWG